MAAPWCEFCKAERAEVYCNSDRAPLCLECDGCVHSANALSSRHLRSLICDRCLSQAAIVRCLDDKLSFCHSCTLDGCYPAKHRLLELTFYNGCPSRADCEKLWPFAKEVTNCRQDLVVVNANGVGAVSDIQPHVKFDQWTVPSPPSPPPLPLPPPRYTLPPYSRDRSLTLSFSRDPMPLLSQETPMQKGCGEDVKDIAIQVGEDLCDSVDIEGMTESHYEIFENIRNQPSYPCDDGGLTDILDTFVTESNIALMETAIEAMSSGSNGMLMNPSIGLGFANGQVPSNTLSMSNINGESSVSEYQDCVSPLFLAGDSRWDSNFEAISSPQARDKAKMRYNEKKKTRTFGKQIRYASRKARADTRKRVKENSEDDTLLKERSLDV